LATITYRAATTEDIETLAALRWQMETERREPASTSDEYAQAYRQDVTPQLASGFYRAWLAEADGEPVACAVLIIIDMPPSSQQLHRKRGYVSSVYTRPEFRSQGIARRLMETLVASARENGIVKLLLNASSMGEPLYLSMGFQKGSALEMEL
jgi:ribosomal protein S18 acetylase RimI-like enzyme